jgi:GNAT superfamily N-acetyltransferase
VTTPAWRLRPSTPHDADWAYALHKAALGRAVERTWGWDEDLQRRMFDERFARDRRQIIRVGDEAVGALAVEERRDELYVALLELRPEWQGRGIGGAILEDLLARAHESGRALALHCLEANPRARAFYERAGLRVVESDPPRLLMRSATPSGPTPGGPAAGR